MEANLTFALFVFGFALGIVTGGFLGVVYESNRGPAVKEAAHYHKAILRMIPHLKEHYTSAYIYHELLNKEGGPDVKRS